MTRVRSLLFSLFVISIPAWAKIDFPPTLSTETEIRAHLNWIRTLVPESENQNQGGADTDAMALIKLEQELVRDLRADPEYMREARRRPDRIALLVRRVRTEINSTGRVNADWMRYLIANGYDPGRTRQTAVYEISQRLRQLAGRTSSGFFSGLAALLPPEDRKRLAIPDPRERWTQIRGLLAQLSLTQLRERFVASRVGIEKRDWTLNDLDLAIDEILNLEARIAVCLEESRPRLVREGQSWLLADSIENWLPDFDWVDEDFRVLGLMKKSLLGRFGDKSERSVNETTTRQLILREVPPYLAIFRGCVGNDCSTSSSWAYSYGPNELSFWIENEDGKHIGYITGAMTEVGGEPTLYIRDVAGPGLAKGDINLILRALYLSRSTFKAKFMTIMSSSFTIQNHTPWQVQELNDFLGDRPTEVVQTFLDKKIRQKYFIRENSGDAYDHVNQHTRVRWVDLSDGSENIRVAKMPAQVSLQKFKEDISQLGILLTAASAWGDDQRLSSVLDKEVDWVTLIRSLRNTDKLEVAQFHANLDRTLRLNGLPSLRNLLREAPYITLFGELNASDLQSSRKHSQRVAQLIFDWSEDPIKSNWISLLADDCAEVIDGLSFLARNIGKLDFGSQRSARRLEALLNLGLKLPLVELSDKQLIQILKIEHLPLSRLWALERLILRSGRTGRVSLDPQAERAAENLFSSLFVNEFQKYMKNGVELLYRHRGLFTVLSESDIDAARRVLSDDDVETSIRAMILIGMSRDGLIGDWDYQVHDIDGVIGELLKDRKLSDRLREKLKGSRDKLRKKFNCERRLR